MGITCGRKSISLIPSLSITSANKIGGVWTEEMSGLAQKLNSKQEVYPKENLIFSFLTCNTEIRRPTRIYRTCAVCARWKGKKCLAAGGVQEWQIRIIYMIVQLPASITSTDTMTRLPSAQQCWDSSLAQTDPTPGGSRHFYRSLEGGC